ncbi:MAG TPA: hypothetical protein VI636_09700 [Candidatus Angelobacter sp.]
MDQTVPPFRFKSDLRCSQVRPRILPRIAQIDFPLKFSNLRGSLPKKQLICAHSIVGNARKLLIFNLLKINSLCCNSLSFIEFFSSLGLGQLQNHLQRF